MSTKRGANREGYDVIVIGGGPAGMMAAGIAAKRGKRVLLVEKNHVLGKKLSITGGGRCNILNAEPDTRKLLTHFGEASKFLFSPFSQFGVSETKHFFESRGLSLIVEVNQRAFPESQDARDVTAFMHRFCKDNGVIIKTGVTVTGFSERKGKLVGIKTDTGNYEAKAIVLASGGSSRPETGSTGDGFAWLAAIGHTVHEANPDIVPLVVKEEWVKQLGGRVLEQAKITFKSAKTAKRFSRTGRLLFTHFGLSSPLILNSANEVKKLLAEGPVVATIDLFPNDEIGTIRRRLIGVFEENKNKTLKNVLKEVVPPGMSAAVAAQLPPALCDTKVHSVSKSDRERLADVLKAMSLTITGTKGMSWAVISDGGIDLAEVDTRTMRSKKFPNLYLCGDILHVSRPSGGYSLQLCWTTGFVAGTHA